MAAPEANAPKYPYEPCKLYDFGGDIDKRWSVEYYVYNRDQAKLVRRRVTGFNRIKTVRARKAAPGNSCSRSTSCCGRAIPRQRYP
jgi:hypothetical protein